MKKITEIAIALFICALPRMGQAQINFVQNGSFEIHSICPTVWDQAKYAMHWNSIDTNYSPGDSLIYDPPCVPDYVNACSDTFYSSVPLNGFFYHYPRTGNGMMQIRMYSSDVDPVPLDRDYLQEHLGETLAARHTYCLTFYTVLEHWSAYALNHIGAYLDDGTIDSATNCSIPQTAYTPQVDDTGIISDTLNWTRIQSTFIATGNEKFITIGNFFANADVDTVRQFFDASPYRLGDDYNDYSFYLIDDVSLVDVDATADAGPDRISTPGGDSVVIGSVQDSYLPCKWYSGGVLIDSNVGSLKVHPAVTTSYVMELQVCDHVSYDTVTVYVFPTEASAVKAGLQSYSLYPNPNDGNITVIQNTADNKPVHTDVYNAVGMKVYSGNLQFAGKANHMHIANITPGLYLMQLTDGSGMLYTLKFVIK